MPVEISATVRMPGVRRRELARKARTILAAIGLEGAELSILLTDDTRIRELNRDWRGTDRPTDVLAFPLREGGHAGAGTALGDVVVSLETARRQGRENGFETGEEVDRLLVHGILHLAGYDHERSPGEARRMQRRERTLRALLAGRREPAGFAGPQSRRRTGRSNPS